MHRPSIGRYTKLEEPKARESLLTPSMRHSASKSSLSAESTKTVATSTSSTLSVDVNIAGPGKSSLPSSGSGFSPLPMLHAANIAFMERTPFAIDDAKDDEDESDEDVDGGENDDQVMDEVRTSFII